MLAAIFVSWAAGCLLLGAVFVRRAPAITVALIGSVVGALAVFVLKSESPSGVPFACAMGATAGLVFGGLPGSLFVPRPAQARHLRWVALAVIVAAPFLGAALTLLLQRACPLYMNGPGSGYCNYGHLDLLGGWITGVVAVFILDAVIVAGLLLMSAIEVEHGRPDTRSGSRQHPPVATVFRDPRR
jgi:uncharacterized membrane protein YeaQ/YmgE (transglycosylase-associated protein family)